MGGRIEPAEPEPPPAHSLGRVGEDDMGRSGKLARPCWLGAGGEALVVRNRWRGWWLGLPRSFFLIRCAINFVPFCRHCWSILCPKLAQNRQKMQKKLEKHVFEEKNQKMTKKVPNLNKVLFAKEVILGPEIDKTCAKNTSKKYLGKYPKISKK